MQSTCMWMRFKVLVNKSQLRFAEKMEAIWNEYREEHKLDRRTLEGWKYLKMKSTAAFR